MEQRRDIENIKPACRLILASASPRRRELLERIGLKPEIHPSTLEENPLCTEPAQVVMELAGQKARDVMAQVRERGGVMTGISFSFRDYHWPEHCCCGVDDEILRKTHDRDEALEMIGRIQGRSHRVYTGVAILTEDRESCFAVETRVDVYPMSDAEIEAYVDCGESMDKAGAYGIQGSFAAHIRGIDGSYTNVMGLPVGRLYQELKRICPEKIEDLLKHTV